MDFKDKRENFINTIEYIKDKNVYEIYSEYSLEYISEFLALNKCKLMQNKVDYMKKKMNIDINMMIDDDSINFDKFEENVDLIYENYIKESRTWNSEF